MTINQLIKRLEKLRDEHGKTVKVRADTAALLAGCNHAWNVVEIQEAELDYIRIVDGDGFAEFNKDGSERQERCILLR